MTFNEIPGYEEIKQTLTAAIRNRAVAHAQLFHGNEGGAALAMALAYAGYLVCENKHTGDACGTCPSCHRASKGIHPDIHYFYPKSGGKTDAAKQSKLQGAWRSFIQKEPYGNLERWQRHAEITDKALQISKEEAKHMLRTVSLKSFEGGYKILIIWCPELMNVSAANAILKALEEPPDKTIYLLVSYALENMLTTITSRTQLITIVPFSDTQIARLLTSRGVSPENAERISRIAEGNLMKAENLLSEGGETAYERFRDWMRACLRADFMDLAKRSEDFARSGKAKQFSDMKFALHILRESVVAGNGAGALNQLNHTLGEELAFIKKFSAAVPFEVLESMYAFINKTIYHLERNANPRITHLNASIAFVSMLNKK